MAKRLTATEVMMLEREKRQERMRVLFKMIWGYPLATKEYKIAKSIDKEAAERIIKEQRMTKKGWRLVI